VDLSKALVACVPPGSFEDRLLLSDGSQAIDLLF